MPITAVQLKGTHNSYHIDPAPTGGSFWALGLNLLIGEYRYTHDPILEQLERGVRHFEFDIHFGRGGRVLNYHLPVLDPDTRCKCLATCLGTIKTWSDRHPTHLPVFVLLEVKYHTWVEDYRAFANPPGDADFRRIEDTIVAAWAGGASASGGGDHHDGGGGRLFVPDELRGNFSTLNGAVRRCGWPSVGEMRQKTVFALLDSGGVRDAYLKGEHAGLRGRLMFTLASFGGAALTDPDVAMIKNDSPTLLLPADTGKAGAGVGLAGIQEAVGLGFLVRTRGTVVDDNSAKRLRAARDSGAQLISMDGATLHADWDAHVVRGEGNSGGDDEAAATTAGLDSAAARCGPVPVRTTTPNCSWTTCNLTCRLPRRSP